MSKTYDNKALPSFHLIIPSAGSASRMGMEVPKPYLKVNGKHILKYTIEKFIKFNNLKSISIAINEDHIDLFHEATMGLDDVQYVIGGKSRKESIYNILNGFSKANNEDIIVVHDAARPMVKRDDIATLLNAMDDNVAATLATPVSDTLIKDDMPLNRENVWSVQTPQAFQLGLLKELHEKYKNDDSFTDDAGLFRADGHKVAIVPSSRQNIKITTADDLDMVANMMNSALQTRTASGFDVHAFEKEPSERKLMLGGIEIEHEVALTGHSDADVVLHSITDAVLGAINHGDIGTHFPPSDPQWKNADSSLFLQEAVKKLNEVGGSINFIDVTIMTEEPKIGPYREAMQNRIAEIMSLSLHLISIKATTTEKLGFTGRKEGIAAQALATIQLPVQD